VPDESTYTETNASRHRFGSENSNMRNLAIANPQPSKPLDGSRAARHAQWNITIPLPRRPSTEHVGTWRSSWNAQSQETTRWSKGALPLSVTPCSKSAEAKTILAEGRATLIGCRHFLFAMPSLAPRKGDYKKAKRAVPICTERPPRKSNWNIPPKKERQGQVQEAAKEEAG
jgi:hypothetical protein